MSLPKLPVWLCAGLKKTPFSLGMVVGVGQLEVIKDIKGQGVDLAKKLGERLGERESVWNWARDRKDLGESMEIGRILIDSGANPFELDDDGLTPAQKLKSDGWAEEMVKFAAGYVLSEKEKEVLGRIPAGSNMEKARIKL